MSFKTLRSPKTSAIPPRPKRFALGRLHVACAVGLLALAPAPSFALELGEAALRSGVGETLVVQIPYRLAAAAFCLLSRASSASEAMNPKAAHWSPAVTRSKTARASAVRPFARWKLPTA